jgi:hypothetical protein
MRIRRFLVAASTSLALAALAAGPAAAGTTCNPVAAKATTTWMADTRVEVGEVAGLVNGVIYISYDETAPVAPSTESPNMVIQTKDGNLNLWVYSKSTAVPSTAKDDDAWYRSFVITSMSGTGIYAGASGDLAIEGPFSRSAGGEYSITGSLCIGSRVPPSRG